MTLKAKRIVIALLGAVFLASLLFVQWMEIIRRQEEAGLRPPHVAVKAGSRECVECHRKETPGVVAHWEGSTHAAKGIACVECHQAEPGDVDAFDHHGATMAVLVTPKDCGACHQNEYREFSDSHHAAAGNILHSLDNFLAETVEGARVQFAVYSPTPGMDVKEVNGLSAASTGCQQCHGSKVSLQKKGGGTISIDDLWFGDKEGNLSDAEKEILKEFAKRALAKAKDLSDEEKEALQKTAEEGKEKVKDLTEEETEEMIEKVVKPKHKKAAKLVVRDKEEGKPLFQHGTWPNTGIGRLNLDGSRGSCSACHSRHDFSPRRARQPENCAKCHLGPDHPQKEIFEESKHGVAYRDLKEQMHLNSDSWVLGKDYSAAPTCATCHLSGHLANEGKITHDPGRRISWTNRPPVSLVMDTDAEGHVVKATDPAEREQLVKESYLVKRKRMKNVCGHCHTPDYIEGFYTQYDDFVVLFNEKFAKPGLAIYTELAKQGLRTPTAFDEEIEWTWFYLWHHEGRRARHGASMMAPDYAHWHGTYEVAERFYREMIPQAREMAEHGRAQGKTAEADAVIALIDRILGRPEHAWFEKEKKPAGPRAEAVDDSAKEGAGGPALESTDGPDDSSNGESAAE